MGKKWILIRLIMLYDEIWEVHDFIMYITMDLTAQHISLSYDTSMIMLCLQQKTATTQHIPCPLKTGVCTQYYCVYNSELSYLSDCFQENESSCKGEGGYWDILLICYEW